MRHIHKPPNVRQIIRDQKRRYKRALYEGAQYATDRASADAQRQLKAAMSSARLGRLGGAVGQTSSLKKRQKPPQPYGVLYAKGGDQSRAGQALQVYSTGATIRARNKNWMAFVTNAVPRTVGRRRLTPELYKSSGLQAAIGVLEFKPISKDYALLVVKNVTLHPRTHRAKRAGARPPRTRIAAKEVAAFELIRVTRRAQRFTKGQIIGAQAAKVPDHMAEFMERYLADPRT